MESIQEELNKLFFKSMSKVVLITGASGGIGSAIALKLAQDGYDLALNYNSSKDEAFALAEKIKKEYQVRCEVFKADVSKEAEVDKMVNKIEEKMCNLVLNLNYICD